MLVWRTSIVLGKKLNALQEILVGEEPTVDFAAAPIEYRYGKPVFRALRATIRWLNRRGRGAS
jgi:hypothetical protein